MISTPFPSDLPRQAAHLPADLRSPPTSGRVGSAGSTSEGHRQRELTVVTADLGRALVVAVQGTLSADSCPALAAALDWASGVAPACVAVDASRVTACDRAGLAPVIDAAASFPERGIRMVMGGLADRYHQLLPGTCSDDLFHLTVRDALRATGDHRPGDVGGRPAPDPDTELAALRGMIRSVPVIEQAKGAIMLSHGIGPDEALGVLRGYAQTNNVEMRELAADFTAAIATRSRAICRRDEIDRLLTELATDRGHGPWWSPSGPQHPQSAAWRSEHAPTPPKETAQHGTPGHLARELP